MRTGSIARQYRREGAQERDAERGKRTDTQQLARLEKAGHGHCEEAEKLRERVAKQEKTNGNG